MELECLVVTNLWDNRLFILEIEVFSSNKVHVTQNPSVVSDSSSLWTELIRQFMQDTGHLMAFVCT